MQMKNVFITDPPVVDLTLCYLGLFFGFIFTIICYVLNFSFIDISLTLVLSCLVYYVLKRKETSHCTNNFKLFKFKSTNHVKFINLSFVLLTLILLNEMYLFNNIFLLYSIIIILSCLVILEFISTPSDVICSLLIIFKIFIIALILRWNMYFQYPSYIGIDPWYHSSIISYIIKLGHLPISETYSKYPIMHILVSIASLVLNISIKNSMFFTVGLFEIISLIYVFLIGRFISSIKTSILATFLVAVSSYHISWGYQIIPMSLGLSIFSTIFYLLFREKSSKLPSFRIITLLFIFLIIFTHTLSTAVTWLFIGLLYVVNRIYSIYSKKDTHLSFVSLSLVLVLLTSMVGYWMYATGFIGYVTLAIKSSLTTSEINSIVANPLVVNLIERELNRIELLLFIGFTILGSLFWFSEGIGDIRKLMLIVSGVVVTFILFSSVFIGIDSLLPDRWYVFLYLIIANISAVGISYFVSSFKNDNWMVFSLVTIVALFTAFAITGAAANGGSAAYSEVHVRNSLTKSELDSFSTLSRVSHGTVTTDSYSSLYFNYVAKLPTKDFEPYNLTKDPGLTILRISYLKQYPISVPMANRNKQGYGGYGGTLILLNNVDFESLYGNNYSKIYDSKDVSGYY
jgi:hypothetical protein